MMLSALFLPLLLTGGFTSNDTKPSEHDPPTANQSYDEGGITYNQTELTENYTYTWDTLNKERILNCNTSTRDLFNHLNLTRKNDLSATVRPAKNISKPTDLTLVMVLYAILDVREKEQTFVSSVWVIQSWWDDYLRWDTEEFCNAWRISLPTKLLWKPDIAIVEMTEKDSTAQTPYLRVDFDGEVHLREDMVVVTTCKMQVYKFPFDTQSCNLTFKSVVHGEDELKFVESYKSRWTIQLSEQMTGTQSDWHLLNITSTISTSYYGSQRSVVIYTITMKRQPLLYVINFILPVLLFLFLDLASFMISERGGEKLSFKVTVLLAVTVMQLILNEILPSSSEKIPLIAVYCIGVFGLMMLSLLETIIVMYLIEKDSASKDNEQDQNLRQHCEKKQAKACFHQQFKGIKKMTCCSSVCGVSSELLPVTKEASGSHLTEDSHDSDKEVMTALPVVLNGRKEQGQTGYWTRMTKTINRVFFIFYITTVSLFLGMMVHIWNREEEISTQ